MSDNLRRYRAMKRALTQLYPTEPKGNTARHLKTLAMVASGIVGSRRTNLPAIAGKVPTRAKKESRVKRFSRWVQNERITSEMYFLPYADALLRGLAAHHSLLLVMDSSEVGRNCLALMVKVVYRKRALAVAWVAVKRSKGHLPERTHVQLLEQVREIVPQKAGVIFLGDGEFDGTRLQATLEGLDGTMSVVQPGTLGWEPMVTTSPSRS